MAIEVKVSLAVQMQDTDGNRSDHAFPLIATATPTGVTMTVPGGRLLLSFTDLDELAKLRVASPRQS